MLGRRFCGLDGGGTSVFAPDVALTSQQMSMFMQGTLPIGWTEVGG